MKLDSTKSFKVLIYGSGNVNPINIVLENILKYGMHKYEFDGLNLVYPKGVNISYQYIQNFIEIEMNPPMRNIPSLEVFKYLFSCFRSKSFITIFVKKVLRFQFRDLLRFIFNTIGYKFSKERISKLFSNYDIINVHWISNEHSKIISDAPQSCKIILSFWGSDLMASSGMDNYSALLAAVERADIITLSSIEMREILLSKFGRQFKDKIRCVLYGQSEDLFQIRALKAKELNTIGKKLIGESYLQTIKYVVKVGYSGFESQNHIKVLAECLLLDKELLSSILFIIPMTYGADSYYINKVNEYCSSQGFNYCILDKYLSGEEALSISFISDVMLNLRDNDGFNNSMIETLFAGKVLVSGGWLPYSELRKNKVFFHEVYELSQVSSLLEQILTNISEELENCKSNPLKLENIVSGKNNGPKWDNLYQEVLKK